ncbi:MAG TPA: hypothetical protein VMH30_04740, partial [Verrucomicrobiae bacterium]|nr:hypothetical protein [Verrucomicrobiae bacterium]
DQRQNTDKETIKRIRRQYLPARFWSAAASAARRRFGKYAKSFSGTLKCAGGPQFKSGVSPVPRQPPHSRMQAVVGGAENSRSVVENFPLIVSRLIVGFLKSINKKRAPLVPALASLNPTS